MSDASFFGAKVTSSPVEEIQSEVPFLFSVEKPAAKAKLSISSTSFAPWSKSKEVEVVFE